MLRPGGQLRSDEGSASLDPLYERGRCNRIRHTGSSWAGSSASQPSGDGSITVAEPLPRQEPADQLSQPPSGFFDCTGEGRPVAHRCRAETSRRVSTSKRIHREVLRLGQSQTWTSSLQRGELRADQFRVMVGGRGSAAAVGCAAATGPRGVPEDEPSRGAGERSLTRPVVEDRELGGTPASTTEAMRSWKPRPRGADRTAELIQASASWNSWLARVRRRRSGERGRRRGSAPDRAAGSAWSEGEVERGPTLPTRSQASPLDALHYLYMFLLYDLDSPWIKFTRSFGRTSRHGVLRRPR